MEWGPCCGIDGVDEMDGWIRQAEHVSPKSFGTSGKQRNLRLPGLFEPIFTNFVCFVGSHLTLSHSTGIYAATI